MVRVRDVFIALLLATLSAACSQQGPPAMDGRRETETWRAKHEADYRREWVTIAGLYFLKEGSQTTGSAAADDIVLPRSAPAVLGRFVLADGNVSFEPDVRAAVSLNGQRLRTPVSMKDDSGPKADELEAGGITVAVHKSGTRQALRVWEPNGQRARDFLGFAWFDYQPDYRVVGRFIRDRSPRTVDIPNTFGDIDPYTTEGRVEFSLGGQNLSLRPFTTRPKRFYFVFKDASSGVETYAAARFLYSDLRDDGTTILDFNQAYNPPCAFNPFTTCPLPMPENRLPVKILAGEKAYPVHVPLGS
jgi:uncharacterized protein (DUF1684 family)